MMISTLNVLCIALVIIVLLMLMRSQMVFLVRSRLLSEESLWLQVHRDELFLVMDQLFARYNRLPSYTAMTLKFWKTLGSFEREAGPVEQYYPLLKGVNINERNT